MGDAVSKGDYVCFKNMFGNTIKGVVGDLKQLVVSGYEYYPVFNTDGVYCLKKGKKSEQLEQLEHRQTIPWNEMKDIWIPEELKNA